MSDHTPGPWGWRGNIDAHSFGLRALDRNGTYVMLFDRMGMRSAQPVFNGPNGLVKGSQLVVYEVPYRKDIIDVDHPDARLIAAAPELLEALENLAFEVNRYPEANEWAVTQDALKAIKKARGE